MKNKILFDLNIKYYEPDFDSEILHSNIYQNQKAQESRFLSSCASIEILYIFAEK